MLKTIKLIPALAGLVGLTLLLSTPLFGAETQAVSEQPTADQITRGKVLYNAACRTCHGLRGGGDGPNAQRLDPRPRNFTTGMYKWRTTPYGQLPTDEDIRRTIREGVSGTDMFPFGKILSKQSINDVAQYVKTFFPGFADPAKQPKAETILKIPVERPFESSEESVAKGKALFTAKGCIGCHGVKADGNSPAGNVMKDQMGYPLRPADLTLGYIKGGDRDQDIYRSISTGLSHTPMIAFGAMTSEAERWQLVDYIRSLAPGKGMFSGNPSGTVYDEE